jgi:hypothetical protein
VTKILPKSHKGFDQESVAHKICHYLLKPRPHLEFQFQFQFQAQNQNQNQSHDQDQCKYFMNEENRSGIAISAAEYFPCPFDRSVCPFCRVTVAGVSMQDISTMIDTIRSAWIDAD